MKPSLFNGLLVIDKPGGITSRDAVDRAQGWFPRGTRLGHTGTLDPLATGVLVLCVGRATRLAEYVQDMTKTYRAGVMLGACSCTDDADGTLYPAGAQPDLDNETVRRAVQSFVGEIEQVPPAFSALKVAGRRAYELARRGVDVPLQARRVRVYRIDIIDFRCQVALNLEVCCGKGTYIRSLARDLGERLGCGALLDSLRRTRVGPFKADDALSLDATADEARAHLLPSADAVSELPRLTLLPASVARLRQGQRIPVPAGVQAEKAAVFDEQGELVAVARIEDGLLHPEKVFA